MKTIATKHLAGLAGLTFLLLIGAAATHPADDHHDSARGKTAVTGRFDWSIVPPNLNPATAERSGHWRPACKASLVSP